MRRYPDFPVFKNFFFPDGHRFFQRIDAILAGFKGSLAVWGRYGNDDGYFPYFQYAGAVVDTYSPGVPSLTSRFGYFFHLAQCHRRVGLKFEAEYLPPFRLIAHRANKYHRAPGTWMSYLLGTNTRIQCGLQKLYIEHNPGFFNKCKKERDVLW